MAKATVNKETSKIELELSAEEAAAVVEVLDFADSLEKLSSDESAVFEVLKGVL